jgi:hypothetical protein
VSSLVKRKVPTTFTPRASSWPCTVLRGGSAGPTMTPALLKRTWELRLLGEKALSGSLHLGQVGEVERDGDELAIGLWRSLLDKCDSCSCLFLGATSDVDFSIFSIGGARQLVAHATVSSRHQEHLTPQVAGDILGGESRIWWEKLGPVTA